MKRISVLFLTLLILLTSCGELHYVETEAPETTESPEAPAEGWTPADLSNIDGIDTVFSIYKSMGNCPEFKIYGEYVYIWLRNTALYRFSVVTGEISSVCTDPLCIGEDCPLEKSSKNWLVHESFVYYIREVSGFEQDPETGKREYGTHHFIHRYDMKNQKDECLYEVPDDGSRYFFYNILDDGYLYYTRSQYVETADKKAYYEKYVCRTIPEEIGKTEEIIYKLEVSENGYSNLLEVTEDYFFLVTGAGESNLVTRISRKDGSTDLLTFPYYYVNTGRIGDYCYYRSCQGEPVREEVVTGMFGEVETDSNGDPVLFPLYKMYYTKRNLLTGEEVILGEDPGRESNYPLYLNEITNNYLYLDFEDGLWRCDHDGNKIKLVRTKEQSEENPLPIVINQLIYGNWIFESDADTFVVYDMESGKYFTFELE